MSKKDKGFEMEGPINFQSDEWDKYKSTGFLDETLDIYEKVKFLKDYPINNMGDCLKFKKTFIKLVAEIVENLNLHINTHVYNKKYLDKLRTNPKIKLLFKTLFNQFKLKLKSYYKQIIMGVEFDHFNLILDLSLLNIDKNIVNSLISIIDNYAMKLTPEGNKTIDSRELIRKSIREVGKIGDMIDYESSYRLYLTDANRYFNNNILPNNDSGEVIINNNLDSKEIFSQFYIEEQLFMDVLRFIKINKPKDLAHIYQAFIKKQSSLLKKYLTIKQLIDQRRGVLSWQLKSIHNLNSSQLRLLKKELNNINKIAINLAIYFIRTLSTIHKKNK